MLYLLIALAISAVILGLLIRTLLQAGFMGWFMRCWLGYVVCIPLVILGLPIPVLVIGGVVLGTLVFEPAAANIRADTVRRKHQEAVEQARYQNQVWREAVGYGAATPPPPPMGGLAGYTTRFTYCARCGEPGQASERFCGRCGSSHY